ncbi:unnamed protein product, partial [Laminaria digitata]
SCGNGAACGAGQYCCNPSCGICAPVGGSCTQQACVNGQCVAGVQCGNNVCGPGDVCCNPSCGICTPPGGSCTEQAC